MARIVHRKRNILRRYRKNNVQNSPTIISDATDDRVMGECYIMLHKIIRNGFFSDEDCGDRRNGYLTKKTANMEHWCATCRRRKPTKQCPLCNIAKEEYPLSEYGSVQWRDNFHVIANAYPYMPNHLLLTTMTHVSQDYMFETGIFKKVCEFYEAFLFSGTMFFNHFAGNSLEHFHVHHTTRCDFPILSQFSSNDKFLPTRYDNVKIADDGKCFRAIILIGKDSWMQGERILQKISRKSLFVNIVWMNPNEYGPVCIVFPRTTRETDYGSTELSGLVLDCLGTVYLDEVCAKTILTIDSMTHLI